MMEYESIVWFEVLCDETLLMKMIVLWRGRSASCEKGDAIPPVTIGRMGVGTRRSQKLPSMCTGEGRSSTHVGPSTPQGQDSSIGQPSARSPLTQPKVRHQQQWGSWRGPKLLDDQGSLKNLFL